MKPTEYIQKNGNRITKPRKIIIDALTALSKPVTVKEIVLFLSKKRENVDLVSIYRTLHLLSEMGMVHVFEFGEGKKRFELMHEQKHHHHLVCDNCGTVDTVSISDEQKFINEVKKDNRFTIKRHSLEFFGLCPKCK